MKIRNIVSKEIKEQPLSPRSAPIKEDVKGAEDVLAKVFALYLTQLKRDKSNTYTKIAAHD